MKKILFATLSLLAVSFGVSAQTVAKPVAQKGPAISVNKEVHNYGDIKQGAEPYCEFIVKNIGTEPLIISNCKGSCGCTVPECTQQPIMPGKTSAIKVKYDTNRTGPINKTVTITSNAVNEPALTVRIAGNVMAAATDATPVKQMSPSAPVEKNN